MSFPYMGKNAGKAQKEFVIKDNETLCITYKPPVVVYSSGVILVERV